MKNAQVLAEGLRFPEGPVAMDDGSVIVTELIGKKLTRIAPDGTTTTVAETGGSPNGLAIGPDGALYCTNSGGFAFQEAGPFLVPVGPHGESQPADYIGGRVQRVDLATGAVTDLYTECDGNPLKGPNDILFDSSGGFWFTDLGKSRPRDMDRGGLYYAQPDGSSIREVVYPLETPNGVGLSPDEKTVYVAETNTGRLWAWDLAGPG
jgi:gluconolactonase